ncbi:MAG: MMPL family transporter, partial [Myxococcales bacterium]|nr:MMPL family transporter [Myxococcales bacterium]
MGSEEARAWRKSGLVWGRLALRFRWPILAFTCLSSLAMLIASGQLVVDNSPDAMLASDSEASRLLDEYRDRFGEDEVFLLTAEGDVFSHQYLARLESLQNDLSAIDLELPSLGKSRRRASATIAESPAWGPEHDDGWGDEVGGSIFADITSVLNVRRTRSVNGRLSVEGWMEGGVPPASELAELRREMLADPTLVGQVLGMDARHSLVAARTAVLSEADKLRVFDAVAAVIAKHSSPEFRLQLAGLPAFNAWMARMMEANLGKLFMLATILMIVILGVVFRDALGVIGPLFVVVQSVIWTFGTMALMEVPLTLLGTILPTFLICVGICDAVHLQSAFRDLRLAGLPTARAIPAALGETIKPIVFTSVTTAVGLLGLQFAQLGAVKNLGLFGAFGVIVAMVQSLVFLPVVLSFSRRSLLGGGVATPFLGAADAILHGCGRLARGRPLQVVLGGAALTVVFALGLPLLEVSHSPLSWFPDNRPLRTAYDDMDEHMGGTSDIALIVKTGKRDGVKNRALMEALEKLERHVKNFKDAGDGDVVVGSAVSFLDPVREAWRAVHDNDVAYYGVPLGQRGATDMVTLLESTAPDELKRLATVDLSTALMSFRVTSADATRYGPLLGHIRAGIARYVGDSAQVSVTGSFYNNLSIVGNVLDDLVNSFGAAFVVIALLMFALLRDVKLGVIAVLSNLLPIVWVLGVMGWAGVPLNMGNLLIASIGIGIAVDDTVHLLHKFQELSRHEERVGIALERSLAGVGRALLISSMVLLAGFGVFATGSMLNVVHFGILISMVVVFALVV